MFKTAIAAGCTLLIAAAPAWAAPVAYTSEPAFAAAAGSVTVETFEGFSAGSTVTLLPSLGITSISGLNNLATSVAQIIGDSGSLPFPMFVPPLPSGTRFLSNDMRAAAGFATGSITFTFGTAINAIGAFVADSAPLDGFGIELFDGPTSLGSAIVGSRTLPNSFIGATSGVAFTSARFYAISVSDSWGLDDLQAGPAAPVPEPGSLLLALGALGGLGALGRRRRPA